MRHGKLAVLLNRNARRVSRKVVETFGDLCGPDLFVSSDLDQARDIAHRVVQGGYRGVLVGGGDGTFVQWASEIARLCEDAGREPPCFGVLPLGTGNALAVTLGAPEIEFEALRRRLSLDPHETAQVLPLMEVEGRLSPFCGFGLDALILEDHNSIEHAARALGLRLGAGTSYALSVALRSLPRFVVSDPIELTVVNTGEAALALDAGGRPVGAIPAGRVLYSGPVTLAACATIPYAGLRMRLYPFAQRFPGRFQLRLADTGAAEALWNLPQIWRGEYHSDRVHDFACTAVEVTLARPSPLQVGGDCVGRRDRIEVALARREIRVFA